MNKNNYVWIIDNECEVYFTSEEYALEYDIRVNPEYHTTKEESEKRLMSAIGKVDIDDLTNLKYMYIDN